MIISHTHTRTQVYYISRGRLKPANKQYSGGVKNDYELTIGNETDVELVGTYCCSVVSLSLCCANAYCMLTLVH